MHKLLQLQHHRHTGRKIQHHHTSYRALLLIILLAGACMLLTNKLAQAATIDVTAKLPAPMPIAKPVITTPLTGAIISQPTVNIGGSCPIITPRVLVVIYSGSTILGSQQCSAIGSFSIAVTLQMGKQEVIATLMTITGDIGQSSDPVLLNCMPRGTSSTATGATIGSPQTSRGSGSSELEIRSLSPFIVYGPAKAAVWEGSFAGGQPPYHASITWGDGKVTWLRNVAGERQSISHQYFVIKPSYRITITLKDSAGRELTMRTTAVSPATVTWGTTTIGGDFIFPFSRSLYIMYSLTLGIMLGLWALDHAFGRTKPVLLKSMVQPAALKKSHRKRP